MRPINYLSIVWLAILTGCASSSPELVAAPCPEPTKIPQIRTEEPGYFMKRRIQRLQTFNEAMMKISNDATNSTSTPPK